MAVKMINLHKVLTFEYSKDPDKGTENATRFQYRALDSYEQAYLQDRISTMENMPVGGEVTEEAMKQVRTRTEVHKVAIEAVRIACTGFDNLFDDEGKPVEFKQEQMPIAGRSKLVLADNISRGLPASLCLEFYMSIMSDTTVSKVAEKKSAKG
jgi:hypothetical protein